MLINPNKPAEKKPDWYLEGSSGSGKKYLIPIDKDPFIIGRQNDCHLILDSKEISRRHAKIVLRGDYLYLSDLKSTNGTYKNKVRIEIETVLGDGDIIHFGTLKFNVFTAKSKEKTVSNTQFQNNEKPEDSFAEYHALTQREKEILYLLLEGKSTKFIADKLCIAEGTAKNHVLKIFKKAKAHSRVSLVNQYNDFKGTVS